MLKLKYSSQIASIQNRVQTEINILPEAEYEKIQFWRKEVKYLIYSIKKLQPHLVFEWWPPH